VAAAKAAITAGKSLGNAEGGRNGNVYKDHLSAEYHRQANIKRYEEEVRRSLI